MPDIFRGQDQAIRITLKDKDGASVNLATLDGYIVYLYNKEGKEIAKFSKNVIAGFGTITEITPASGIFEVKLESETSKTSPIGKVFVEVKVEQDDSDYANSTFFSVSRDDEVGDLKDSQSKDDTDLTP